MEVIKNNKNDLGSFWVGCSLSRSKAKTWLREMHEHIKEFGYLTVQDSYTITGISYRDDRYTEFGWTDIDDAVIYKTSDGWTISLTMPKRLSNSFLDEKKEKQQIDENEKDISSKMTSNNVKTDDNSCVTAKMIMDLICQNIRDRDITKEELATILDYKPNTVSKWFSRSINPSMDTMLNLLDILDIQVVFIDKTSGKPLSVNPVNTKTYDVADKITDILNAQFDGLVYNGSPIRFNREMVIYAIKKIGSKRQNDIFKLKLEGMSDKEIVEKFDNSFNRANIVGTMRALKEALIFRWREYYEDSLKKTEEDKNEN